MSGSKPNAKPLPPTLPTKKRSMERETLFFFSKRKLPQKRTFLTQKHQLHPGPAPLRHRRARVILAKDVDVQLGQVHGFGGDPPHPAGAVHQVRHIRRPEGCPFQRPVPGTREEADGAGVAVGEDGEGVVVVVIDDGFCEVAGFVVVEGGVVVGEGGGVAD